MLTPSLAAIPAAVLAAITNLFHSIWAFLSTEAIEILRGINLPAFMTDVKLFVLLTIASFLIPDLSGKKKKGGNGGDNDEKPEVTLLKKVQRILSPILLVIGLLGSLIPPEVSIVLALLTFLVCGAFMALTLCATVKTLVMFVILIIGTIVYLVQGEIEDAAAIFLAFILMLLNTACSIMLSVCSCARLFLRGIGA